MRSILSSLPSFLIKTLLITSFITACDSKAPVSKDAEIVRPAKLLQVGQSDGDNFLNYPAVIESQQLSALSFEVGGTVKELPVIEAQKVKKGDMLAKLDQKDLLAKLSSVQAQFKNADTEYQRAVRLMKADAISTSDLEKRKSQRDVSWSAVESAQKALENSVLVAPYDGAISKVSIKLNQIVQAGSSAIDILGKGGLEAVINLPSSILATAKKRTKPDDSAFIVLDAAPNLHIPTFFKEVALVADSASQTYPVTFKFKAPETLNILPGMNAVVWFKDPSKRSKNTKEIRIPLTAIATDGDEKYVWVVNINSMAVSKRTVIVEKGVGTRIGILNGLKSGEIIVVAGISALSEGMKVSAWSE